MSPSLITQVPLLAAGRALEDAANVDVAVPGAAAPRAYEAARPAHRDPLGVSLVLGAVAHAELDEAEPGVTEAGGVPDTGMTHVLIVTGGGRPEHPFFNRINIGLGNIRSAIVGTWKSFDSQPAERNWPTGGASTTASTCARAWDVWRGLLPKPSPGPTAPLPRSGERRRR